MARNIISKLENPPVSADIKETEYKENLTIVICFHTNHSLLYDSTLSASY